MHQDIERTLFTPEEIRRRIAELGAEIARRHAGEELTVVALLKGGVIFLADLIRSLDLPIKLDFAWASSYGDGTTSSRDVKLKVFPHDDLAGKTVLLVDDILDTGRTLAAVTDRLKRELGAKDVRLCVLLDKAARREVPVRADYVGFVVEDVFVVGYGLDYADRYRNLPYIGVLKPEAYRKG
ncbi:MAG TPA: hypoxanthine phosphoribosyltransferase [Planctomycetota bacterium]|nr:hypoxanthine phosphoribosyltransferase [Planctomycetota bacterium]